MKRFIIRILLFFAVVAAIDFGVGCIGDYLTSHVKSGDTKRTNDLVMNDCHDVLIFGSSRARHHYDTPFLSDTLGLDVYNAGYDGNGVILAYGLLEMILNRYQPKLIIYDVEPAFDIYEYEPDNNHKRYITRLKPYYQYNSIGEIIKDVSTEEWYKVHSGMIRYNMSFFTMFREHLTTNKENCFGFVPMNGVYTGNPSSIGEKSEVDVFKLKYIEKFIQVAKANQVPILFVASPKYTTTSSSVLQPVKEICRLYNVEFLDYFSHTEFTSHREWFKEPQHLNAEGARAYSLAFISQIVKRI